VVPQQLADRIQIREGPQFDRIIIRTSHQDALERVRDQAIDRRSVARNALDRIDDLKMMGWLGRWKRRDATENREIIVVRPEAFDEAEKLIREERGITERQGFIHRRQTFWQKTLPFAQSTELWVYRRMEVFEIVAKEHRKVLSENGLVHRVKDRSYQKAECIAYRAKSPQR
jgi:hypothetical protein